MSYWGNLFGMSNKTSNPRLNGSNDTCSYRFTAQASKTVAQVHVYVNAIVGTSPTYRIGLQGDDGGDPDGSWLGTNAYVDQQLVANVNACNITDAAITASTVYHLVIEHQSGTIDGSNYAQMKNGVGLSTRNLFYPLDGAADTNLAVMWSTDGGSSWGLANAGYNPTFLIEYDDASYDGSPYEERHQLKLNGVDFTFGQKFTVPSEIEVSEVDAIMRIGAGAPNETKVYLYNATDTTYLVNGEVVDISGMTGSYAWLNHPFASNQTLTTGKTYKLWYHTATGDGDNYIYVITGATFGGGTWDALTFQDTTGVRLSGAIIPSSESTGSDICFRFTVVEVGGEPEIQLIVDGGVHQLIVDGGVIQPIITA